MGNNGWGSGGCMRMEGGADADLEPHDGERRVGADEGREGEGLSADPDLDESGGTEAGPPRALDGVLG